MYEQSAVIVPVNKMFHCATDQSLLIFWCSLQRKTLLFVVIW